MALRNLVILPEAEQDASLAYIWYEEQEPGLGEEFLRCVDACIQFIRRNPEMYRVVHEIYRRGIVRRFPCVVFYEHQTPQLLSMQFSTVLKTQRNGVVGCHRNNQTRQNKSLEPTVDILSVEVRDHLRLNSTVR